MIKISIPKHCSCTKKKNSWTKQHSFETLDEATKKAKKMCKKANKEFCQKHYFEYEVKKDKVIIHTLKVK